MRTLIQSSMQGFHLGGIRLHSIENVVSLKFAQATWRSGLAQ